MRFWIRELMGWLLVGLGLFVFLLCYAMLVTDGPLGPLIISAGPVTFIGFIIFRGGIHLLKVATAARICLHAQAQITRQQKPARLAGKSAEKNTAMPLDW